MQIRTTSVAVGITLAISVFFVAATPLRAHALVLDTLRDTTRSVLKQLTNPGGTTSPSQSVTTTPSSPSTPTTTQQTPTSPASTGASPIQPSDSKVDDAVQSADPLPLVTSDLQRLSTSSRTSNAAFASTNLPAQTSRSSSSQGAFLQATPEGWRVMGLLWYWWAIDVILAGLVFMIWRRIGQRLMSRWAQRRKPLLAE